MSTPALEAVIACSEPDAVAEAELAAHRLAAARAEQAAALASVPGVAVLPGVAPYLLLRLPAGHGERVRHAPARRRASRSGAATRSPAWTPTTSGWPCGPR